MKTITFESDALANIFETDYCIPVVLIVDVHSTKGVNYSTPFGDSYGWSHDIKISKMLREVEIIEGNSKQLDEVDCSEFLSNPEFKNEVEKAIKRFMRKLC